MISLLPVEHKTNYKSFIIGFLMGIIITLIGVLLILQVKLL
jgi:heme/copper-type cytochrome/quinol oxidase subunit 4